MSFLARGLGIVTVATAAALGGPFSAWAADPAVATMFGAAPPIMSGSGYTPADETPVTFASNWYLRGDLGVSQDVQLGIGNATLPRGNKFPNTWSFSLGAGYKFNDWIRGDLTLDWRAPRSFNENTSTIACVVGWLPVKDINGNIVGETPVHDSCKDWYQARLNNTTLLMNLYADLGTWWGLTPYIGAGVGVNYVYQKASQNWYMSNGVSYQVYVPDAINPTQTWYYNYDQQRSLKSLQFAYAFMAGLSYAVTPHMSVDIGGRYVHLGKVTSYSTFGSIAEKTNNAKEVRIGIRYYPD